MSDQVITPIFYRVLYVFFVSNWHVHSKLLIDYFHVTHNYVIIFIKKLFPVWAKHTVGILLFTNMLSRYPSHLFSTINLWYSKWVGFYWWNTCFTHNPHVSKVFCYLLLTFSPQKLSFLAEINFLTLNNYPESHHS